MSFLSNTILKNLEESIKVKKGLGLFYEPITQIVESNNGKLWVCSFLNQTLILLKSLLK
jgi:hypothetical protein